MIRENEALIRQYAAGEITWSLLRQKGFDNVRLVLAGLGEFALRPPMAPRDGPNVAARERGRAVIREALKAKPDVLARCFGISEEFGDSVMEARIIVIENDTDLTAARAIVSALGTSDDPADVASLRAQALVLQAYEARAWPSKPASPAETTVYLADQFDLTPTDLRPMWGKGRGI